MFVIWSLERNKSKKSIKEVRLNEVNRPRNTLALENKSKHGRSSIRKCIRKIRLKQVFISASQWNCTVSATSQWDSLCAYLMIDFKEDFLKWKINETGKITCLVLEAYSWVCIDSKRIVKKGIFVNGKRAEMLATHYACNHIR